MNTFPSGSNNLLLQKDCCWLDVDRSMKFQLPNIEQSSNESKDTITESKSSSSSELNWEVVGEDLLLTISDKHKDYLANIFPGCSEFDDLQSGNSIYGGTCVLCSKLLLPDDTALDYYDCRFYCSKCHQNQLAVIPKDILESWDFTKKPVSFATKAFLDKIAFYPIINLAKMNPSLFAVIDELSKMRRLRRQLSLLWSHLTRCCRQAANELAISLKSHKYMLTSVTNIDTYSIADLVDIHSGDLEERLITATNNFALAHINFCPGCKIWITICDICGDLSRPIWPHMFVNFRRCLTSSCGRAMHFSCLVGSKKEAALTYEIFRSTDFIKSQTEKSMELTSEGHELLPYCTACRLNLQISNGLTTPTHKSNKPPSDGIQ